MEPGTIAFFVFLYFVVGAIIAGFYNAIIGYQKYGVFHYLNILIFWFFLGITIATIYFCKIVQWFWFRMKINFDTQKDRC